MVGLLVVLTMIIVLVVINLPKKEKTNSSKENMLITKKKTKETKEETPTLYKVDIKGEVVSPGIYSLEPDSRVIDVIEHAGGLTEQANTTVINLSKKIADEMVIIIYSNTEVRDFENTKEKETIVQEKCNQKDDNSLKNDACITSSQQATENTKISLNTATIEQLMTLPGIGEAKAKAIIAYRDEQGGFKSIEELTKVTGIGESILAKIKDSITI